MKLIVRFGDDVYNEQWRITYSAFGRFEIDIAVYIRDDCTFSALRRFIQDRRWKFKKKRLQTEWVITERTYRGRERKKIKEENKRRRYWPALGQIKSILTDK
jgi:hypothetical protein